MLCLFACVYVCVCVCERERERERDFYVSGKTCLPFHGHKTAIRSYYQ